MPYKKVKVSIEGRLPHLQANGQMANPLYHWARISKPINAQRKKSEEDIIKILEYNFKGSLYIDGPVADLDAGPVVVPSENVHAMLKEAAKNFKLGKVWDQSVTIVGNFPLKYKGPKTRGALWEDESFRHTCMVKRGNVRVLACRPIFREWALDFEVSYVTERMNPDQFRQILEWAGDYIGLSDWKYRNGLFSVTSMSNGR